MVGGGVIHKDIFNNIICLDNLFGAWKEFKRGKRKKPDVQNFEFNLENNIFTLHQKLKNKIWKPDPYISFYVRDPKLRCIHKATVRDRVLNQAIYKILYPIFDRKFIFDSYSCRLNKGTHKGVLRLESFARKLSKNYRIPIYALKCDIRKFFDSVDHNILLGLIKREVKDENVIWLIEKIIKSFEKSPGKGLPLGNVTSQLFANVYLNEFDQYTKHILKEKYYLRYCDDFVILDRDKDYLLGLVTKVSDYFNESLKLGLHSDKIILRKLSWGIDFLGYVILPYYKVLRTRTKQRMLRKIKDKKKQFGDGLLSRQSFGQTINSYLGILKHCKGFKIKKEIEEFL